MGRPWAVKEANQLLASLSTVPSITMDADKWEQFQSDLLHTKARAHFAGAVQESAIDPLSGDDAALIASEAEFLKEYLQAAGRPKWP
jgi:hypothetical protein